VKNPIDRITQRWRRKKEREDVRHTLPDPGFSDATKFEMPSTRKGASPSRVKRFHEHGLFPEFSKKRRERNKQRRLVRMSKGNRLPHGRAVLPGPRQRNA
jgi:hypothetical protein